MSVGLRLPDRMFLVLLLLHTAWRMMREDMLAVRDLHGEAGHGWAYGFRVEKLVEDNMAPVFGLVAAFVGVTYLDERMDGVLALLFLMGGLIWQVVELLAVAVRGLLWLFQQAWDWVMSLF